MRKDNYFTFIVIPHTSSKRVINFRIPSFLFYSLMFFFFAIIIIVTSSIVYTGTLTRRLVHYKVTLAANEEQKRQIDYFSQETSLVKRAISELLERDNELRRLLGLRIKDSKVDLSGIITTPERERLTHVDFTTGLKISKITTDLTLATERLKIRQESLKNLQEIIASRRARFAATPSIWPIYGRIVSGFGYRYSPWRGLHTGIDISAWFGEPVRAAADGVVVHAGWLGGYGRSIKIDHGYGLVTLYGHNSKLIVSIGSRVRKGSIIAYAGASGLATGPHLHYEIRKHGYLANPIRYLNLDIFTASRVWE